MRTKRHIETHTDRGTVGELHCHRSVDFKDLSREGMDDEPMIRVYGGHACANLQLRGIGPITDKGKPRRMIATASYLGKDEVRALIDQLEKVYATLP